MCYYERAADSWRVEQGSNPAVLSFIFIDSFEGGKTYGKTKETIKDGYFIRFYYDYRYRWSMAYLGSN